MTRLLLNKVNILVPEPEEGWTKVWRKVVVDVDIANEPYFNGRFLSQRNESVEEASIIVALDSKDDGQGMIRIWQAVQKNSNERLTGLNSLLFSWKGRPEQWPAMLKQARGIVQRAIALGTIPEALQPALPGIVAKILALQGFRIQRPECFNFLKEDNPRFTDAFLTAIDVLNHLDTFCMDAHGTGLHDLVEDE